MRLFSSCSVIMGSPRTREWIVPNSQHLYHMHAPAKGINVYAPAKKAAFIRGVRIACSVALNSDLRPYAPTSRTEATESFSRFGRCRLGHRLSNRVANERLQAHSRRGELFLQAISSIYRP
jgi:hypothetical protein